MRCREFATRRASETICTEAREEASFSGSLEATFSPSRSFSTSLSDAPVLPRTGFIMPTNELKRPVRDPWPLSPARSSEALKDALVGEAIPNDTRETSQPRAFTAMKRPPKACFSPDELSCLAEAIMTANT